MPGAVPTPVLVLWLLLMLAGVGFWISFFFDKESVFRMLAQGAVWLDWRPLPRGLFKSMLFALFAGLLVQSMLFQPLLREIPQAEIPPSLMIALSLATLQLPVTLSIVWYIPRQRIPIREALGFQVLRGGQVWKQGMAAYCVALPVLFVAGSLTMLAYHLLGREPSPQYAVEVLSQIRHPAEMVLMFLLVGILGPICEEVIFRGVLFPVLSQRFGIWTGLLAHSAVFALIHQYLPGFLSLFLLSLVLALVYQRTRNLMSAVVLHILFNSMTLLVFFLEHPWGEVP